MAVKNYGIHDKWTDLDKLNNIDIKSVDGVIESVKINGEEAGGGSSWQTVFEGSVTTVSDDPAPIGTIENLSLNTDTIKVTFNGTEYECNKHADGSYGASFDESTEQFDWSTYPFALANLSAGDPRVDIYTQTAGTYTLKIEERK